MLAKLEMRYEVIEGDDRTSEVDSRSLDGRWAGAMPAIEMSTRWLLLSRFSQGVLPTFTLRPPCILGSLGYLALSYLSARSLARLLPSFCRCPA